MNLPILIEHILDSAPENCDQKGLIDHIVTALSRANATRASLREGEVVEAELCAVPAGSRARSWHLRYDSMVAQTQRIKDRCHHVIEHRVCVICGTYVD